MRHRKEPIRDGIDQVGKCLLVAALCTFHEFGVHAPSNVAAPDHTDATSGMGDTGLSFFKSDRGST
jgi:hypothetical protein